VVVREANSPLTSTNSLVTLASKVSNLELVEAMSEVTLGCSLSVVWIHLVGEGVLGCGWWPFGNEGCQGGEVGPWKKWRNDIYDGDQGEKRNAMG
jgi:hypothetical protein